MMKKKKVVVIAEKQTLINTRKIFGLSSYRNNAYIRYIITMLIIKDNADLSRKSTLYDFISNDL